MARLIKTRALVQFYAEMPDEDGPEADKRADDISHDIELVVETIPAVVTGSVSVFDWTEVPDDEQE